jgi:hypothetical protein
MRSLIVLVLLVGCAAADSPEVARLARDNEELRLRLGDLKLALADRDETIAALDVERARLVAVAGLAENARELLPKKLVDLPPISRLETRVSAVDSGAHLVLLSCGSKCAVRKGYTFSVYRGAEFVGKVVVEKVQDETSGCRVLFTKEGWAIEPGDLAARLLE